MANIVEQLLKADIKKADELETGVFRSRKLAKILGMKPGKDEKEAYVEVKIREVRSRRVNDIMSYQIGKKGEMDYSKTFDAKLMMCIDGVAEPDLRDKELQAHFLARDARELCEKLFGSEVTALSDAVSALSGIGDEDSSSGEEKGGSLEDKIKNW